MGMFLRRGKAPPKLTISGLVQPTSYHYVMVNGEKLQKATTMFAEEGTFVTVFVSAADYVSTYVKITLDGVTVASGKNSTYSFLVEKSTSVEIKGMKYTDYTYYTCEIKTLGG